MKKQLLFWSICLLFTLFGCSSPDDQTDPPEDFFVTKDLSFLQDGLPAEGAKAWPSNGCKEFEIKLKIAFLGEVKTTMQHCCVNYVCNAVALTEVMDFFLGDKASALPDVVEIIASKTSAFMHYDIRPRLGVYQLSPKSGKLQEMEYEVWVRR